MRLLLLASVFAGAAVGTAAADHQFHAIIIGANADNKTIEYRPMTGIGATPRGPWGDPVKATLSGDCAITEGYWYLGKPAGVRAGPPIEDGIKNGEFKNATTERPVQCRIFTADTDDPIRKIKRGVVTKIIVYTNPYKN